jgi:hypothetical protein
MSTSCIHKIFPSHFVTIIVQNYGIAHELVKCSHFGKGLSRVIYELIECNMNRYEIKAPSVAKRIVSMWDAHGSSQELWLSAWRLQLSAATKRGRAGSSRKMVSCIE